MTEQLATLAQSKLASGIASTDTSLTLVSATGFPGSGNFRLRLDTTPVSSVTEIVEVGSVTGTILGALTRGTEGTAARSWLSGATATVVLTAAGLVEYVAEQVATETTRAEAAEAVLAADAAVIYDETLWSTDPRVNVPTNGTSDCAAAINAGIAMAVAATGGRFALIPTTTYMIKAPLEILGRVKFGGIEARNTIIKQDPAFVGTQMLRNWTAADWNSGIGETDGRTVPSAIHSGTHGTVPYPQLSHLHIQATLANTSLIAWIGQQESSYIEDIILDTTGLSATNQGIWGIDMQDSATATFNAGRIGNIVGYGNGWERFLSFDGSASGGSDVYVDNIVSPTSTCYHSVVYVNRVTDVEISRLHMEQQTDAGAEALIYLSSAYGFTLRGGGMTVKQAQAAPFLRQVHSAPGAFETPAIIDGFYFYDSMSSGSWDTAWPAGFIIDLFNTIPNPPNISSGATTHAAQMIHRYDGTQMTWTDNAKARFQTYFKKPDIAGLTDVQLNSTYLSCPGLSTQNGQGYTTPDAVALDLTTLDLRCMIEPSPWSQLATAPLICKNLSTGNQKSYQFEITTAGKLTLVYSTDGSTTTTLTSSVAAGGAGPIWVRVVADLSATTFSTSPDNSTWTTLGSVQAALSGALFNSSAAVAIAENSGTDSRYAGRFYKAELRASGGSIVASIDLTLAAQGASYTDPQGNVWTAGSNSLIAYDQRLDPSKIAPGANGQVLTIVSGVPTWV